MPLTFLAIGDPHFKKSNAVEIDEVIERILGLIKKHKPRFVVILGDLLDKHEHYTFDPMDRAINSFLRRVCELVKTYLIVGNHDLINNQQFCQPTHPYNACKIWDDKHDITIVDEPLYEEIDDIGFTFVPYVPPGRFHEALKRIDDQPWDCSALIFAHQEFEGCQLSSTCTAEFSKSTIGDKWPSDYPPVMSGHIHTKHIISPSDEGCGKIYYLGALGQHAFGDSDDKAIWLCTIDDDYNMSYVELDMGMPKRILVKLGLDEVTSSLLEKIKNTNDYYKLEIECTTPEYHAWKKTDQYTQFNSCCKLLHVPSDVDLKLMSERIDQNIKGDYWQILHSLINEKNEDVQAMFQNICIKK